MADIQFPNVLFGPGTFTATVLDNNGHPASVLDAGQQFTIHVERSIDPLAARLWAASWQFASYVEAIGPGAEQQVGPTQTCR